MQWLTDVLFNAPVADQYPVFVVKTQTSSACSAGNKATGNILVSPICAFPEADR
jgi:hypothetical protein